MLTDMLLVIYENVDCTTQFLVASWNSKIPAQMFLSKSSNLTKEGLYFCKIEKVIDTRAAYKTQRQTDREVDIQDFRSEPHSVRSAVFLHIY